MHDFLLLGSFEWRECHTLLLKDSQAVDNPPSDPGNIFFRSARIPLRKFAYGRRYEIPHLGEGDYFSMLFSGVAGKRTTAIRSRNSWLAQTEASVLSSTPNLLKI